MPPHPDRDTHTSGAVDNIDTESCVHEIPSESDSPRVETEPSSLYEEEELRKRYGELIMDDMGTDVAADASSDHPPIAERIWELVRRNWKLGLFCLVGLSGFNYWEHMVENKMRVVDQLEQRRDDMRKRLLFITADLASMQRVSNIEQSVRELGLPLEHSLTPPYEIHLSGKSE